MDPGGRFTVAVFVAVIASLSLYCICTSEYSSVYCCLQSSLINRTLNARMATSRSQKPKPWAPEALVERYEQLTAQLSEEEESRLSPKPNVDGRPARAACFAYEAFV